MEYQTKIITEKDRQIIPAYSGILRARMQDIAHFYSGTPIVQETLDKYTKEYLSRCLSGKEGSRLVGHFSDSSLDGILIETFKREEPYDITVLGWIMANKSGLGIGSRLITDSIQRARAENKAGLQLVVANENLDAQRLYGKLGFREIIDHPDYKNKLSIMNMYLDE